jgi:structural maintenance of chromosome 3 (chondroitin sulfate proteoglycan 6)
MSLQELDRAISEADHSQRTLAQTRREAQAELTDFIRTRTEIECIVKDLEAAGASAGGKREQLEAELAQVQRKVVEKEAALEALLPEWDEQRTTEATEKRRLDEANAKLNALFAKQGRASKFRTKSERDGFLRHEIQAMKAYQEGQTTALEGARLSLETSRRSQVEIDAQIQGVQEKIDDGRKRVKDVGEEAVRLKDQLTELTERRKDLWREDTRLDSMVSRAADELRTAERALAGMMDKVSIQTMFQLSCLLST